MADAISHQLYSKSRKIKVNDPNKTGVDTAIVHTNTAKTQSEMVSHIATTKRYCNIFARTVEKWLKHNRKLNSPKTT